MVSGVNKFTNFKEFPYDDDGPAQLRPPRERSTLRRYLEGCLPDAKIALLYQNDDLGKDFLCGV